MITVFTFLQEEITFWKLYALKEDGRMDIIGRWCADDLYRHIDPGKDGAMAVIAANANVYITPFEPDAYRMELEKWRYGEPRCCLERVGAMPKQGVSSMFHFGENYGFIQGLLTAYSIPYELVTPNKWKKEFQVTSDKNSSIAVCKRLFPVVSLRKTERCRTDHDGMAEALLMAEYARRRL